MSKAKGLSDERSKMLAGEWYDANYDEALIKERAEAAQKTWAFNQARPGSAEQMRALEEVLGTALPSGLELLPPLQVDYGTNIHFGENCFVNHNCYFMDGAPISFGSNVFIGPSCGFYTANHPLDYARRNQGLEKALPISVGNNCWFGGNVVVLPGVTIEDGCVIAAGSVVTSDVPANSVVAGVPAKVVRHIEQ